MEDLETRKLSLQQFLQLLTSHNLPISRAMAIAGKIYKEFNTPQRLGQLTDPTLSSLGVADKEDRKLVLGAIIAAGYRAGAVSAAKKQETRKRRAPSEGDAAAEGVEAGNAPLWPAKNGEPSQPKKRKRDISKNEYLPDGPSEEATELGSLDFHEILDEEALKNKSVVINRAPVMMAWSFVVSERLGFNREEALSIASVYTEMNAIAKGVSLGIYDKSKQKGIDASPSAQPYVDLMGRRVPLYQTAEGTWRALAAGKPAPPTAAYSYISRSLKQTAPAIIGAMRLLAESYSNANELNRAAWSLYADFRPEVDGWGKKGSIRCETLLGLRKSGEASSGKAVEALVKYEEPTAILGDGQDKPPESKKHRTTPLDDEDEDALFEHFTAEELEALP